MTALLDVRDLSRRFPVKGAQGSWWRPSKTRSEVHAVDGVSFTVAEGETLGLVGESGCGKSTLARVIARLIDPTDGRIVFEGREIGGVPARQFGRAPERARIQMVFQDPTDSLNPRFTAFAAIADPLRRLRSLDGAKLGARVAELAHLCGLAPELLGRFPHQLSGGQKARVGIARAIAVEPRLLILDEPTSALDVSVQVLILRLLDDLKQRLGLSYVFVSHDLNVVRLLCDRVIVMYSGKIVEAGPTAEVFAAPAHPYTAALIAAIPVLDATERRPHIALPGEPRSPVDPDPNVCRFYGRCPKGVARCGEAMPDLVSWGDRRAVACHFAERTESRPAAEALAGVGS